MDQFFHDIALGHHADDFVLVIGNDKEAVILFAQRLNGIEYLGIRWKGEGGAVCFCTQTDP